MKKRMARKKNIGNFAKCSGHTSFLANQGVTSHDTEFKKSLEENFVRTVLNLKAQSVN